MSNERRPFRGLAKLLPAGALGLSIGLAAAAAQASTSSSPTNGSEGVAARLKAIRSSVSAIVQETAPAEAPDDAVQLAWWGNGFHRWGWGNGGWGNGGWHNWGNGWGNGGWHNWGNGWHNW